MPTQYFDFERNAPFFQVEGAHAGKTRVYFLEGDSEARKIAKKQAYIMERTAIVRDCEPRSSTDSDGTPVVRAWSKGRRRRASSGTSSRS